MNLPIAVLYDSEDLARDYNLDGVLAEQLIYDWLTDLQDAAYDAVITKIAELVEEER